MLSTQISLYLTILILVWLAALTVYLITASRKWLKYTENGSKINLAQVLESILNKQDATTLSVKDQKAELEKVKAVQKKHFQKFALVRFNPFEDTGGDQSFVIALLDEESNGIVLSSLHSRNGTRVYAKSVTNGQSQTHEFSKEEKEVVEKAIKS